MDYDPKDLQSVLVYTRNQFGAGIFEEPSRMVSILLDLAPGLKRDGNVLRQMSDAGLLRELRTASESGAEYDRIRLTAKSRLWLTDYLMLPDEKADYFMTALQAVYKPEVEVSKSAIIDSGRTGDCTWTLDSNYLLTISGHGMMGNYGVYCTEFFGMFYNAPWPEVNVVVIERGVTSIGDAAFQDCSGLTSVTIPNSVTSIGYESFSGCSILESVTIPDSVTSIGWKAFQDCDKLKQVSVPKQIEIDPDAFPPHTRITRR